MGLCGRALPSLGVASPSLSPRQADQYRVAEVLVELSHIHMRAAASVGGTIGEFVEPPTTWRSHVGKVAYMTRASVFMLERPPVTLVSLRITFDAAPRLQNWMLAPFLTQMRADYPSVNEVPPRGRYADPLVVESDESQEPAWPVPRTQFKDADCTIAVQGDELEVTWDFNDDADNKYVGFEALQTKMQQIFERLVGSVEAHGVSISPTNADCFYINRIPEIDGRELAVGVITQWNPANPPTQTQGSGYVGVRFRTCANPAQHECHSMVMVDSHEGQAPQLSLHVRRPVIPSVGAMGALAHAHEELIMLFAAHTSQELREKWGEA